MVPIHVVAVHVLGPHPRDATSMIESRFSLSPRAYQTNLLPLPASEITALIGATRLGDRSAILKPILRTIEAYLRARGAPLGLTRVLGFGGLLQKGLLSTPDALDYHNS